MMTDEQIAQSLHKMVDRFGEMLANPILAGTLPMVKITLHPDEDGDRLQLTVGAEFVGDEE